MAFRPDMLAFRALWSLERLTIGRLRSILMLDTAANPDDAGEIQRNGANLFWHNGTTAQQLNASGGSAPADADYLVGTAHAGLSAEIAVGTTPGGELGGTWAAPTVDTTHSGSAHHAAVTLAADADTLLSLSTQELGLDTQTANTILAGPTSGGAADPSFRAMVAADLVAHGASAHTNITRTFYLPAPLFISVTGAPDLAARGNTADVKLAGWALDPVTDEGVTTSFYMPSDWDAGAVTFSVYWSPSTTNNGNLIIIVNGSAITSAQQIDQAADYNPNVTQAASGTAENLHIMTPFAATPTSAFNRILVYRWASNVGDTFTGDAWFHGLLIEYTATQ